MSFNRRSRIITQGIPNVAIEADRERALVIDDDEEVGAILVEMLEHEGLQADRVVSGTEALQRLEGAQTYDVVFLDVRLPDIDGPEVYDKLAASNPTQARRDGGDDPFGAGIFHVGIGENDGHPGGLANGHLQRRRRKRHEQVGPGS